MDFSTYTLPPSLRHRFKLLRSDDELWFYDKRNGRTYYISVTTPGITPLYELAYTSSMTFKRELITSSQSLHQILASLGLTPQVFTSTK